MHAENPADITKIVSEDLPDSSLPIEHQLEFSIKKITAISKICLDQASKISSMQRELEAQHKSLTETKSELRKSRQEAARLQVQLTENDVNPYRQKLEGAFYILI